MRISPFFAIMTVCAGLARAIPADAEGMAVRYPEGLVHGFLTLETPEGKPLADGDLLQSAHGDRVTSRLVFHFRDGSLQDETVVFRQRRTFELLTDHLVQQGPSFPHPMEVTVDRPGGVVTVKSRDSKGKETAVATRMDLPDDLANGLILTLMKNLPPGTRETMLPLVAATPKPLLVHLAVSLEGEDTFSAGSSTRKGKRYVVRVKLPAVKAFLARLLGKTPPDTRVWIFEGDAPTFLKSEGPAFLGGPPWRISLTSPTWPKAAAAAPR